jgi:hypothetical protein
MAGANETGTTPGEKPRLSVPLVDLALYGLAAFLAFHGVRFASGPAHAVVLGFAFIWAGLVALPQFGWALKRQTFHIGVAPRIGLALLPIVAAGIWVAVTGLAADRAPRASAAAVELYAAGLRQAGQLCETSNAAALVDLGLLQLGNGSIPDAQRSAAAALESCEKAASKVRETTPPPVSGSASDAVGRLTETCWGAYHSQATALASLRTLLTPGVTIAVIKRYRTSSDFSSGVSSCETDLAALTATAAPPQQPVLAAPDPTPDPTPVRDDSNSEGFVTMMVKQHLSDPDSARLSNVTAYRTANKLTFCGLVNAKNRMGGYAGPTPFILADSGVFLGSDATPERIASECKGSIVTEVRIFTK